MARVVCGIVGANVNVRSAFTFTFTFTSAFSAVNAAANARERERGSMDARALLSRVLVLIDPPPWHRRAHEIFLSLQTIATYPVSHEQALVRARDVLGQSAVKTEVYSSASRRGAAPRTSAVASMTLPLSSGAESWW